MILTPETDVFLAEDVGRVYEFLNQHAGYADHLQTTTKNSDNWTDNEESIKQNGSWQVATRLLIPHI